MHRLSGTGRKKSDRRLLGSNSRWRRAVPGDVRRAGVRWLSLTFLCLLLVLIGAPGPGALARVPTESAGSARLEMLSGRVYQGEVWDETTPISGVTMSLHCSDNPDDLGSEVASTTTDAEGWYGLLVPAEGYCDYYHIVETDLSGYVSVGAQSVGGVVVEGDPNWIRYTGPLDGQTLTGNKFWDQLPVLSGRVFLGGVGDETTPISGVTVSLYCSDNPASLGTPVDSTTTDVEGWYGLAIAEDICDYYHIQETDLGGYVSVGARSVSGVVVEGDPNWIRYTGPLDGQTLTGNKFWDGLPDLAIVDAWPGEGTVCYVVENVGSATAPGGHVTRLLSGGVYRASHTVAEALAPEQRSVGCFDYDLLSSCTPPQVGVSIIADYGENVTERDETNNGFEAIWPCELPPPRITSGPTVSGITVNSAVVSWTTDRSSDGLVLYGPSARDYAFEQMEDVTGTMHTVELSGLAASTTYHLKVRSAGQYGGAVESSDVLFRTQAETDSADPTVTLTAPALLWGAVTVSAQAADNRGVGRVEFRVNGETVFTDYAAPYQFELDSDAYDNGRYDLSAHAFDLAGNSALDGRQADFSNLRDVRAPTVLITAPSSGGSVSGKVNVVASLNDDTGLAQAYFLVDNKWEAIEPLSGNPTDTTVTFEWDTTGLLQGSHTIQVQAYDIDTPYARWGSASLSVNVVQAAPVVPPKLKVSHDVTRYDNYFAITLIVENVGGGTATNVEIWDYLQGFQPISTTEQTPVQADYEVEYDSWKKEWKVEVTSHQSIPATSSRNYTYFAVPVMFDLGGPTPRIGHLTGLHYDQDAQGFRIHDWFAVPAAHIWGSNVTIPQAYDQALKEADYVIVTNPDRLYKFHSTQSAQIQSLLSDMAELARYKNGALGFLTQYDKTVLRDLVKPHFKTKVTTVQGGAWAKKLHANFSALKGYMLIVGECHIVPPWTVSNVKLSDQPYSDVWGNDSQPDIALGRIPGNTPADLRTPIQTSINIHRGVTGYGFDHSHALTVSGDGGGTDRWEQDAKDAAGILDDEFSVDKLLWNTYKSNAQMLQQFRTRAVNKDVIFFSDHGGSGVWSNVIGEGDFPVNFGSANPFAFAAACSTGNYNGNNDETMSEAFLDSRAAAYLGATESSFPGPDTRSFKVFFKSWVNTTKSVGAVFLATERYLVSTTYDFYWVREYNLYGDPKIGWSASAASVSSEATSIAAAPPLEITIDVPDYQVTPVDGADYVEIPGGTTLAVEGKPELPIYSVQFEYDQGYEVQEVILTDRSGVSFTSGLNITPTLWLEKGVGGAGSARTEEPDWYPRAVYEWNTYDNPDGTATLVVVLYPFYYNSATTAVEFFQHYEFEVRATEPDVAVASLTTDKHVYAQGEDVSVDIGIVHTGTLPVDVVVSAVIVDYGTGETVDGLLLSTLEDLSGEASFSLEWESDSSGSGLYDVEVTLKGLDGDVLDKRSALFEIGPSVYLPLVIRE